MILQFSLSLAGIVGVVAKLIGLAVFTGLLSASVALVYRWYVRERVPSALALLVGLAGVAVILNTTPLLAAEIDANDETLEIIDALSNIVAFAASAGGGLLGARVGDRIGTNLGVAGGTGDVDADVSEIVQTVGRVTSAQLPEEIADIVGYDPVSEATKETLAERRFLFPRRLTRAELRERLVTRLETDYGVGHVDVEFTDDGTIEFLAVGSRAAGIGPTLPPATNAVAVRADPAHAASAGDLVQVWETDPMRRAVTGELRGVAGDVVTVAIDAADTPKLTPSDRYKLVTLPVRDRPDREFASLLRAADETLATVSVEAGSDLDGVPIGALDVTVAAITREDERPEPLPARDRTIQAGDVVYAIATPELLRKVDDAAQGPDDAGPTDESTVDPADESAVDQADEPADDGATADENVPAGDAFADIDDLPGVDLESEMPAVSGERTTEADDVETDDSLDDLSDGSADEAADSDADESTADADEETVDDDAVPFTPLDVGDDDPLADPLTDATDDDGGDEADPDRED